MNMPKETLIRIGRVAAVFLRALAIAIVSTIFFLCCRLPMRELDIQTAHRIVSVFNALINFFCFQSVIRAFYVHDRHARRRALSTGRASTNFFHNIGFALKEPSFWVDTVFFLWFMLPFSDILPPYFSFRKAFFYTMPETDPVVVILVPIITHVFFFIASLIAHDSVRRAWAHQAKHEQYMQGVGSGEVGWRREAQKNSLFTKFPVINVIVDLLISAVVYTLAPAGVWMIALVAIPFIAFFGAYSWMLGFIIAAIVLFFAIRYLRAIRKRRAFVRNLTRVCSEKGIPLSPIKAPYRSLFTDHVGENFSVEYKGQRYDCKLLGTFSRATPFLFSPKGYAIRRRNVSIGPRRSKLTLFHIDTEINLAFSGEGKKAVILLPIPNQIFLINDIGSLYPIDTGDRIGDYCVYNASGFLGALERDFLDRREPK